MEKENKNDIIKDSYYLINLFHRDKGKTITQLHVQKLMFLFEAYYMNATDKDQLYECGYKAWNFGPVAPKLYKRFKNCGKENIVLTKEEEADGDKITEEKKKLMDNLYETFKDFSAMELVSFTHSKDSPWKEIWDKTPYGDISKSRIKEWFSKYVEKTEK